MSQKQVIHAACPHDCPDTWFGTSHESGTPGVIRHSLTWIMEQCQKRGLQAKELSGQAFDGQTWLRIHHQ